MLEQLKLQFIEQFNVEPEAIFFAPGRVNLIGEHTDYNGGNVFPCALTIGTYALVSKRDDRNLKLYSSNFDAFGVFESDLDSLGYKVLDNWTNYPKGVISTLVDKGYVIDRGLNILFFGNIPNGAGLSSSASIELVMGVLLNDLFNLNIGMIDLVKIGQLAENKYIGVNCGIMDQFAIGMGKEDCAILLDTNTLNYEYAPLNLGDIEIVIANTNKRRGLADSKYNERRSECETALSRLQSKLDIKSLGDLTIEAFLANEYLIEDEILTKRAKHAVYENIRTLDAVKALRNNDLTRFGQLMNESHISLRDDYEVTGIELDTLVEAAWEAKAIGSRMTGAGFGGCTVSLVKKELVSDFVNQVSKSYEEKIGYAASFYIVGVGAGARKLM